MLQQGIKIVIIFYENNDIIQTSYCGNNEMFRLDKIPKFVLNVEVKNDSFEVCIRKDDLNNLYNYIRENGTSLIKQY